MLARLLIAARLLAPASALLAPAAARAERFEELGPGLGLYGGNPAAQTGKALIAGVTAADLDEDGDLDLVSTEPLRGLVVHLREGPIFRAAPEWIDFTTGDGVGYGHTLFDMDGDGDLDLYFARDDSDRLYENVGDKLVDVSSTHLPGLTGWSSSATAADLDGDGDLDLLVARYIERVDFPQHGCHDNLVLDNDGAGRFRDISAEVGLRGTRGCSFTTVAFDLDGDLDLDLLTVNDFAQFVGRTELWRNDLGAEGPRFTEVSASLGLVAPVYGMGAAIEDLDQDGRLDVFITNIGEPLLFEIDPETARFTEVGVARGLSVRFAADRHQVTWTTRSLDLDRDGHLDLIAASGSLPAAEFIGNPREQQSIWLRGAADGTLVSPPASGSFALPDNSMRDFALADLTGDGRPEIIAVHIHGGLSVLRDTTLPPPPTTLALVPRTTAPGAAGAVVRLACEGTLRTRHVTAGGDYGNADQGEVDVSFPPPCPPSGATLTGSVRWPSGYEQAVTVTSGARSEIVEDPWLALGAEALEVDLGAHLGPATTVAASARFGPAEEVGPRRWRLPMLEPRAGEVAVGLRIDDRPWGLTLRVGRPELELWLVPPRPIVGRPLDVLVRLESEADRAYVRLGSHEAPLVPTGDGLLRAVVTPTATGPATLEILTATRTHQRSIEVRGPISEERSALEVRDLHILTSNRPFENVRLRLRLADDNGRVADVPLDLFSVAVDGVPFEPLERAFEGRLPALRLPHEQLRHGAELQVLADGAPLFEPQLVVQLDSPFDLGRHVSVERSWCALSEPHLRADGVDRGSVILLFFDAQGALLPDLGLTPLFDPSGIALPGVVTALYGGWLVPVRAGAEVAAGTLSARLSGMARGVSCPVPLAARPVLAPALVGSPLTLIPEKPTLDEPWLIRFSPIAEDGRGLGSGVGFRFEISGAESEPIVVRSAKTYVGLGRYEVAITPRLGGPIAVAVIADDGRTLAARLVAVEGGPVDPGPESVESGPEPIEPVEAIEAVEDGDEAADEVAEADLAQAPDVTASDALDTAAPGPETIVDEDTGAGADWHDPDPEPVAEPASEAEPVAGGTGDDAEPAGPDTRESSDASAEAGPRPRDEGCRSGAGSALAGALAAAWQALHRRRRGRRESASRADRRGPREGA